MIFWMLDILQIESKRHFPLTRYFELNSFTSIIFHGQLPHLDRILRIDCYFQPGSNIAHGGKKFGFILKKNNFLLLGLSRERMNCWRPDHAGLFILNENILAIFFYYT